MSVARDLPDPGAELAGLKARSAALRQAAGLPRAQPANLLEAALAELDAAITALDADQGDQAAATAGQDRGGHSDRRLLHAAFTAAPAALLIVDREGIIRRANAAACELLQAGPGYPTGKPLASLVEPATRAAVQSQLAAVARTGTPARQRCGVLASRGAVGCELAIRLLTVRGEEDSLLVMISPQAGARPGRSLTDGTGKKAASKAPAVPATGEQATGEPATGEQATGEPATGEQATGPGGHDDPAPELAALTQRFDLLAAAATQLLENAGMSDSVLLQRCARLLAAPLATWVIVDVQRRGALRRHFVTGPDDRDSARLAQVAGSLQPDSDTLPGQVAESGHATLITHAEDDAILGTAPDGVPLLTLLGAASVLCVPVTDGESPGYGVLTLARPGSLGQFSLAEAGLVEEIAGLLARAISMRLLLRRQSEAAEALRASLLPPVLRSIPGVEIASAHMPPTRGREVGGDFYDVYPTPGGWGLAIGDVCGKGDAAAAATAAARHAIRVLAHWSAEPAEILRGANQIMLAEEFGSRFVTADAAQLCWHGRTLRVVLGSAGHPGPVVLRQDGSAQQVPGGGLPLGIFPDPEPATQELDLSTGDVLFFCTDGLTGARSPAGTYLEDQLTDSLTPLASRHPAEILSDMRKLVLDFCVGELADDLTMLALRVGEPPEQ